jgi:hypothetical protein
MKLYPVNYTQTLQTPSSLRTSRGISILLIPLGQILEGCHLASQRNQKALGWDGKDFEIHPKKFICVFTLNKTSKLN